VQVANDLADGLISGETAETLYAYRRPQAAE
jgi:N-methylhydantoinase B